MFCDFILLLKSNLGRYLIKMFSYIIMAKTRYARKGSKRKGETKRRANTKRRVMKKGRGNKAKHTRRIKGGSFSMKSFYADVKNKAADVKNKAKAKMEKANAAGESLKAEMEKKAKAAGESLNVGIDSAKAAGESLKAENMAIYSPVITTQSPQPPIQQQYSSKVI